MTPCIAPVLVVGGGPAGLVAALTLLQNNVPVRIIDKEHEYRVAQRSNGIWPRAFELFHFLGVFEAHQQAKPIYPMREYKPGTLEINKTFPFVTRIDATPSIPYSNPMFLGQPVLEGILRSHLAKYGCTVELGTELRSFEDDGERVIAKLVKTMDGEETSETFEASYLIGADGGKGITRKQIGLTFLGETKEDFDCVVGDLCLELPGVDREHWHVFGDRATDFFTLRPTDDVAPDGHQFLISMKDYTPQQLIDDEKLMVKCMSRLTGHEVNVRKIITLSRFRPNIRMVDRFGSGRVFVAGDAAHVHSPTGGQGLNTSVQDALNLAWKLALVYKALSPASLLDSYTAERLPVIAEMLDVTTGMLDKLRSGPIESAMERGKKLNMLGVNYRTSALVLDEFTQAKPVNAYRELDDGELVAGDRAPGADALVSVGGGAERRMFDLFSATYHTVLVFVSGAAADVLEVSSGYPADLVRTVIVLPRDSDTEAARTAAAGPGAGADVVVDRGGHAYRAYLAVEGEKRVVVVRPDGVVGAIVRGGEGVGAYFTRIFG